MDAIVGTIAIVIAYAVVAWRFLRWHRDRLDPVDPYWPHDDQPYDLMADPYLVRVGE